MDFFEQCSKMMPSLSNTEQTIARYIMTNLSDVKKMSTRDLASSCYVSAATVYRFVKHLGYDGYNSFIISLKEQSSASTAVQIPKILKNDSYRDNYLNNLVEAVQIVTDDKAKRFLELMNRHPRFFILADGLSKPVAQYIHYVLNAASFDARLLTDDYEYRNMCRILTDEDAIFVLSYPGNNANLIHVLEQAKAAANPTVMTITRSDNNGIYNLSDLNFYIFADEITLNSEDITTRGAMIAIFETMFYRYLAAQNQ